MLLLRLDSIFSFQCVTFLRVWLSMQAPLRGGTLPASLAGEVLSMRFQSPTYAGKHQPVR